MQIWMNYETRIFNKWGGTKPQNPVAMVANGAV